MLVQTKHQTKVLIYRNQAYLSKKKHIKNLIHSIQTSS